MVLVFRLIAFLLILLITSLLSLSLSVSKLSSAISKYQQSHILYASNSNSNSNDEPLFSFGLIADIQYADCDDTMNFQQTKMRRYRQSLKIFRDASLYWQQKKDEDNILFAVILGDILDGKCQSLNNRDKCYNDILDITKTVNDIDYHYCFGNHCHYSFSRKELHRNFVNPNNYGESKNSIGIPKYTTNSKLYYDFSPVPGWRFISLDSYDISLIGASSAENKIKAHDLLSENNPNDLRISGSWFDNLPFDKYRFVPYNGGVSTRQLRWLEDIIIKSKKNNEKVIVYAHQPIHAPDKPQSLIWNSEDIKRIISKGNVVAFLAGHDHDGQFDIDNGITHIVPTAPIEVDDNDKSYGIVSVFPNKIKIKWTGKIPKKTRLPWTEELLFN